MGRRKPKTQKDLFMLILDKWYEWEKLIKEVTFLAFPRNDTDAFYSDVEKMKQLIEEV